ncbi:acyltransferase family protein [Fundidesulfovibrio putealis]|uniref:acyltransferase family protein n=1 Tax=Fundidesulfovibrio putealis TaxID=270496 RepID=UPI001F16D945|nr:heparan-alpha-glucosaminide N-acetyltransferase domain-containing protein [Fundidesulfovibrio putealis]
MPYGAGMSAKCANRIVSVDFLRGLTVAFMVVANNPGDTENVYRELVHARWHGWTAVDFIFPMFLFLVGVSVALAVRTDAVPSDLLPRALKRAGIIFLLGLFVNGFPFFNLDTLRIPGVLQRIAVVYLAALWLHMKLTRSGIVLTVLGILVGYWLLWTFVPVPGLGRPSMDMEYNLEGWLDQTLLRGHIWEYDTPWDPEGLLSTVPCVAMALFGVLAGRWLKSGDGPGWTVVVLMGLGLHLTGLAWNEWFPINKLITTSSFVLFVGGVGIMLTATAHRLLDGKVHGPWIAPFLALGRNALFVYVTSQLLTRVLYVTTLPELFCDGKTLHFCLFDRFFGMVGDKYVASVFWAVALLGVLTAAVMLLGWLRQRRVVR